MYKKDLLKIRKFIVKHVKETKKLPTQAELEKEFLPDVSKYKDKVLVHFSNSVYRMGSLSKWVLLKNEDYDWWSENGDTKVRFGEIYGKHSDVNLEFQEVVSETINDPYEIHELINSGGIDLDTSLAYDMKQTRYEVEGSGSDSDERETFILKSKEEVEEEKEEEEEEEEADEPKDDFMDKVLGFAKGSSRRRP